MRAFLLPCFLLLTLPFSAAATVEIGLEGRAPTQIGEVYLRSGVSYLAIEDLLTPLGLSGRWDSVEHLYRIATPQGTAILSPGSSFLRLGDRYIPLEHQPRFIDGRLRVGEELAAVHLARLVGAPIYYRNLNPGQGETGSKLTAIDQLFALLLQKKAPAGAPVLRGVAIDPGHGGEDSGVIGNDGAKEKDLVLAEAHRLEKLLKMQLGVPVYLSRDGDYNLTPQRRLESASKSDVDALLLLHAQGSFAPDASGVVLFVRPRDEGVAGIGASMQLAEELRKALLAAGIPVSAVQRAPLLPLGRGNLPTVLVELGFLTNGADLARMQSDSEQERLAQALVNGLKVFTSNGKK